MATRRNRIKIEDLNANAIQDLNEDDIRKIMGGSLSFSTPPSIAREYQEGGVSDKTQKIGDPVRS